MKTPNQHLKPQDVLLMLKIVSDNNPAWSQSPVAADLGLSQSEVSEAVARGIYAGLIAPGGKTIMRSGLMEFLQYGLRYVFPIKPGAVVRGVPTSHSASPLNEQIVSSEAYVWPYGKGTVRGHSIMPLYPSVPEAALKDANLYQLLALADALRVGRARERTLAVEILKKRLGLAE